MALSPPSRYLPAQRAAGLRTAAPSKAENGMNEDVFNMDLRKFLKKVGVTSQREIEQAVREAIDAGKLKGTEKLKVKAHLTIEGLSLKHDIDGEISLS
jgi:hypothetical protein